MFRVYKYTVRMAEPQTGWRAYCGRKSGTRKTAFRTRLSTAPGARPRSAREPSGWLLASTTVHKTSVPSSSRLHRL